MTRRELLRRAAVIGLSGPALGGFLAACASGTGTTKSAAPATGTTVLTPPAKGEVDRVNWGLFYEPSGLDWIYDYNYEENTVVTNITESLLRLTPQLTIEPSLAASFSETDPAEEGLPDPAGRDVPRRQPDDRRRCRVQPPPPAQPELLLELRLRERQEHRQDRPG